MDTVRLAQLLADPTLDLAPKDRRQIEEILVATKYDWAAQARPSQLPPAGNWRIWVILAGRGWGKTRTGAETVNTFRKKGHRQIGLIAPTAPDARDVMIEGVSGVMNAAPPWDRPTYYPTKRRVTWKDGSQAIAYSAEEPERLRGPQHSLLWGDEPACLIGDTPVMTSRGEVPIRDVRVGDVVLTRSGWFPVKESGRSGRGEIWRLEVGGLVLFGTADHPVWTETRGFVPLSDVKPNDMLLACRSSSSTERNTGSGASTTRAARADSSTAPFGNTITALSQMAGKFITSTATSWTTASRTFRRYLAGNTLGFTLAASSATPGSNTPAGPSATGPAESPAPYSASAAARSSCRSDKGPNTATRTARRETIDGASVRRTGLRADVYNLTIDGPPEFFAGGLLVHNSWRYAMETFDMAMFGLRVGKQTHMILTGTPKPTELVKRLAGEAVPAEEMRDGMTENVVITYADTYENMANLSQDFIAELEARYGGTRLFEQEVRARILDDNPDAIFKQSWFDTNRLVWMTPYTVGQKNKFKFLNPPPTSDLLTMDATFEEVVVAIDPATTSKHSSNETGIIVAARDDSGRGYMLQDLSGKYSPDAWANRAILAARRWSAARIVAERNQGGEMVQHTIRSVMGKDLDLDIRLVSASKNKAARAEPISALCEKGSIFHVGEFPRLESQLVEFVPSEGSPSDRFDAYNWAFDDLLVSGRNKFFMIG